MIDHGPANPGAPTASRVFIAYPRKDRTLAERVATDLHSHGIPIWIDKTDIQPGSPNWEKQIRRAINEASAIVVIATPNTPDSDFVGAEVTLGQRGQCTIIPFWLEGEHYVDCVSLGLLKCQYIDGRGSTYESALGKLVESLSLNSAKQSDEPKLLEIESLSTRSSDYIPILINRNPDQQFTLDHANMVARGIVHNGQFDHEQIRMIAFNPGRFVSFEELLFDLYGGCLQDRYGPFQYAEQWILAKIGFVNFFAVPWLWLEARNEGQPYEGFGPGSSQSATPLYEMALDPQNSPVPHSMTGGAVWAVVDNLSSIKFTSLLTKNENIAALATGGYIQSKILSHQLRPKSSVDRSSIDANDYPYRYVIDAPYFFSQAMVNESQRQVFVLD